MPVITANFYRSLRLLEIDKFHRSLLMLTIAALFLTSWIIWLLLARISQYEISDSARIEVARAAHPIESPINGRVKAIKMRLGQQIATGDLLVELDSEREQLEIGEERQRLTGLTTQLQPIQAEIRAAEAMQEEERRAAQASLAETRAQQAELEVVAQLAEEELRRINRIHLNGLVPEVELLRAKAVAEKQRAAVKTLQMSIEGIEQQQRVKESQQQAVIERLNRDLTLMLSAPFFK